jgi:hypothetical protein
MKYADAITQVYFAIDMASFSFSIIKPVDEPVID